MHLRKSFQDVILCATKDFNHPNAEILRFAQDDSFG